MSICFKVIECNSRHWQNLLLYVNILKSLWLRLFFRKYKMMTHDALEKFYPIKCSLERELRTSPYIKYQQFRAKLVKCSHRPNHLILQVFCTTYAIWSDLESVNMFPIRPNEVKFHVASREPLERTSVLQRQRDMHHSTWQRCNWQKLKQFHIKSNGGIY